MKTLMDFWIKNPGECHERHFCIDAESLAIGHDEFGNILLDVSFPVVYEYIEGEKKEFIITTVDWAGRRLNTLDAFNDIISRLSRNETGWMRINNLDISLRNLVETFHRHSALTWEGRNIPYFILFDGYMAALAFATDQFLYYENEMGDILMFSTADGTLISDNEFAEIGFEESQEMSADGQETVLSFTKYEKLEFI